MIVLARPVVQIRLTEAEKAQWISQAGSRTLSDYLKFLVQRDGEIEWSVRDHADLPDTSPVAATRAAVAQLTPKQQKAAPVSVVGRGFGSPGDLSAGDVTTYFKSVPAPKKGRR